MIKLVVTTGSFVLGGAGVALVAYLSVNPRAFTHPLQPLPSPPQRSLSVDTPVSVASTVLPDVMILPEVMIQASLPPLRKASRPLEPCSEWSDVGAKFIAREGATG